MPNTNQNSNSSSTLDPEKVEQLQEVPGKVEYSQQIQDKADNVNGQRLENSDFTKADYVEWSEGVLKGDSIDINAANEQVYLKYVKNEDGVAELKEATYSDRYKDAMQKSFVDSVAGLPVDLALDSVYTGFVSHFVRDTVKTTLDKTVMKKFHEWWDGISVVVCDAAFTTYDPNPLMPKTSAFMLPSGPLDTSARFETVELEEMKFGVTNESFLEQNQTGNSPNDVPGKVDSSPEFFYISRQSSQNGEESILGTLRFNLAFSSMAHFEKFNSIVKKVGDKCHVSLRFRRKRKILWFSGDSIYHEFDLKLTSIQDVAFSCTDDVIKRRYEFDIIDKVVPDIELNFGPTKLVGFYSMTRDKLSYQIHCSNIEAEDEHSYVMVSLPTRPFKDTSATMRLPINYENINKVNKRTKENVFLGRYTATALLLNKSSGKVDPFAFLNGIYVYYVKPSTRHTQRVKQRMTFSDETIEDEETVVNFLFRSPSDKTESEANEPLKMTDGSSNIKSKREKVKSDVDMVKTWLSIHPRPSSAKHTTKTEPN